MKRPQKRSSINTGWRAINWNILRLKFYQISRLCSWQNYRVIYPINHQIHKFWFKFKIVWVLLISSFSGQWSWLRKKLHNIVFLACLSRKLKINWCILIYKIYRFPSIQVSHFLPKIRFWNASNASWQIWLRILTAIVHLPQCQINISPWEWIYLRLRYFWSMAKETCIFPAKHKVINHTGFYHWNANLTYW